MNAVYVVGLTGPTGSGKSTAAAFWGQNGLTVLDADKIARQVTDKGSRGLYGLMLAFGKDIVKEDGTLDRALLASRAFADEDSVRRLNDITHPLITMEIRRQIREFALQGVKTVILDAPLLFESGVDRLCDDTVVVLADTKRRLPRVIERDGITEEVVRLRMRAQKPLKYYESRARHVVYNNGTQEEFYRELKQLEIEIRRASNRARR